MGMGVSFYLSGWKAQTQRLFLWFRLGFVVASLSTFVSCLSLYCLLSNEGNEMKIFKGLETSC